MGAGFSGGPHCPELIRTFLLDPSAPPDLSCTGALAPVVITPDLPESMNRGPDPR